MKNRWLFIVVAVLTATIFIFSACAVTKDQNPEEGFPPVTQEPIDDEEELEEEEEETEEEKEKRYEEEAIEQFEILLAKVQREGYGYVNKIGSEEQQAGKKLEDIYLIYSDNIVIQTFYFYNVANIYLGYYEMSPSLYPTNEEEAKEYLLRIDVTYDGIYAEEVFAFAEYLLGANYQEEALHAKEQNERFDKMSIKEKAEVYAYSEDRWNYYDTLFGKYSGDRYSEQVLNETAEYFDLLLMHISEIRGDEEVMRYYNSHKTEFNFERKIVVGISPGYEPFEYYVDNELVGFDVDLITEILATEGFSVEFCVLRFEELLPSIDRQETDCVISAIEYN